MENKTQSPSTSGEKLYREVKASERLPEYNKEVPCFYHDDQAASVTFFEDGSLYLRGFDAMPVNEKILSQIKWLEPYTPAIDIAAMIIQCSELERINEDTQKTIASIQEKMKRFEALPDAGREAIGAIKWITENGWHPTGPDGWDQPGKVGTDEEKEEISSAELYALFSSRPVESSFGEWLEKYCDPHKNNAQPFICLKCKRIHESEPEQCECGGKTFQKTHPSSRPVQVSPSINEQHLIAAARYGFKYATESQTHNDESVPDGNVLQWWQWYQAQPEFTKPSMELMKEDGFYLKTKTINMNKTSRPFSAMTDQEATKLLQIAMTGTLPKEDKIKLDEISVEIHHNDGGLMMDGDCAICIDVSCRCFEGQLAIRKNGDLNLINTDTNQWEPLQNQIKMFSYLASRNFKVIQRAFAQ